MPFVQIQLRNLFFGFFFLCSFVSIAQDSEDFRKRFVDANYHIEFENYDMAVKEFTELVKEDPDNANLNYKAGYSIIKSNKNKRSAIPYLEKAVANTTTNYDDLNPFEKKAPIASHFYLGVAYHVGNQLDKADASFDKFKEVAGKKHYLQPEADHHKAQVAYARELMKDPINVIIKGVSDSINTEYADYSPVISLDESMIIFTSRRPGGTSDVTDIDGQYFEDIFVSERKSDGTWSTPKSIGPNINTADHEATIGLSADGQTLFIYKGEEGGSIYMSELVGDEWSVPTALGSDINTEHWETHAALAADNRTLYFTSNRPGGYGGRDIWLVKRLPNGMWAKAQNAGPVINTKYDEDAPFLHPDGKQLYFSSNGHKSMGGFDVFFSDMQEDGKWSTPTNLRYPINTTDDDIFYVTSADGTRAYFSSMRDEGKGEKDIYLITLPDAIERQLTVLVGYIKTSNGEGIPDGIHVLVNDLETGELVGDHKPNTKTGKYIMALSPGNYTISYSLDGTEFYTENIYVPAESSFQQINKELELDLVTMKVKTTGDPVVDVETETEEPETVTPVVTAKRNNYQYQEFLGYNIEKINTAGASWQAFLDTAVAHINRYGDVRISIESSASKVPTKTYGSNQKLTKARAESTKELLSSELKARGIDPSKVKYVSTSTLVLGPNYRGDYISGREKYEKYQYVKLITK